MRLIFTTVLFMVGWQLYAQQCDEKHILTGPSGTYSGGVISPANPEQSANNSRFNWMLNPTTDGVQFRFTPVNGTTKYLLSPWHVSDPNIDYYNLAKGTNSDYKPADGWEVFKVNLGRLNDDVTMRLTPTLIPYIMLYNRYTAILRVFGYLDRTSDYHQMVITLNYDDPTLSNLLNVSALLSINDRLQQTLDSKTSVNEVKAVTNYANNQYLFFWTDFPLAYDPCACLYKSNLTLQFKAITTADISLTGTIIGKVVPIAVPSSDFSKATRFLSSVVNTATGFMTGNFANFASGASSILGITNLNDGVQEGLDVFLNTLQAGLTIFQIQDSTSRTNTTKRLSDKEKVEKTLASISTYFSALGKSGATNSMALTATAVLNGKSIQDFSFQNSPIRFSTPGSKDSHLNPQENYNNVTDANGNVRPEYVTYNEILGTFALLKKPVVNISYQPFNSDPPMMYNPNNPWYVQWNRIRFSIPKTFVQNGTNYNNSILYAFNPIMHPNYNKTDIKVGLVVKKKMGYCPSGTAYTGIYNNNPLLNVSPVTSTYPNMTDVITPLTYDGYEIYDYLHQWQTGPK
jgi:hypothetical protein